MLSYFFFFPCPAAGFADAEATGTLTESRGGLGAEERRTRLGDVEDRHELVDHRDGALEAILRVLRSALHEPGVERERQLDAPAPPRARARELFRPLGDPGEQREDRLCSLALFVP